MIEGKDGSKWEEFQYDCDCGWAYRAKVPVDYTFLKEHRCGCPKEGRLILDNKE